MTQIAQILKPEDCPNTPATKSGRCNVSHDTELRPALGCEFRPWSSSWKVFRAALSDWELFCRERTIWVRVLTHVALGWITTFVTSTTTSEMKRRHDGAIRMKLHGWATFNETGTREEN